MNTHRLLIALALVAGSVSTVAADLKWTPESIPSEPTEKEKNPAPSIRVKLDGEPLPTPDVWATFTLRHDPAEVKGFLPVAPIKAIPYHRSSETLGIVVLVEAHEFYFGNDTYKTQTTCPADQSLPCKIVKTTPGVYATIRAALEAAGTKDDEIPVTISRAGPPGSKGALIFYSQGAEKMYEGDLKGLTADKLGDQRAQEGKTSREFLEGLRMSADVLKRIGTNRKALFIFSDGVDVAGGDEFTAMKKQFDTDKIEVYTFYVDAANDFLPEAGDANALRTAKARLENLATDRDYSYKAQDADKLKVAINSAVLKINSRFQLVFPGRAIDAKTKRKAGFKWDGQEHVLQLRRGDEDIINYGSDGSEKVTAMVMAPEWGKEKGGSLWWLWIAIPGGVLALFILGSALGKKKPVPPPVVVAPVAVAPPPPMAAPSNAQKTMMVNISSGDGLPVVGWLVPIAGDKQFQTFKLQYGETRVGTTSNAHIVLSDGFMSTDHAKIVMSPTGFTLMDNNSTNGTFVNERRVQRHELVDNDLVMFGKTPCKFKTILGT
ncbi:MAG: FHA domain-containing protein [Kofleriaceae bacterium]